MPQFRLRSAEECLALNGGKHQVKRQTRRYTKPEGYDPSVLGKSVRSNRRWALRYPRHFSPDLQQPFSSLRASSE
jgi:hypothetical protein